MKLFTTIVTAFVLVFVATVGASAQQSSQAPRVSPIEVIPVPDPSNDPLQKAEESLARIAKARLALMEAEAEIQRTAPVKAEEVSACSISTTGVEKNARKLIELKCELELASLRRQIYEVGTPKPKGSEPVGFAAKNASVTKVTYREEHGRDADGNEFTSIEGSKDGAKHVEHVEAIRAGMQPVVNTSAYGVGYGYGYSVASPVYYSGAGYRTPYSSYESGAVYGGGRVYGGGYSTGKR